MNDWTQQNYFDYHFKRTTYCMPNVKEHELYANCLELQPKSIMTRMKNDFQATLEEGAYYKNDQFGSEATTQWTYMVCTEQQKETFQKTELCSVKEKPTLQ